MVHLLAYWLLTLFKESVGIISPHLSFFQFKPICDINLILSFWDFYFFHVFLLSQKNNLKYDPYKSLNLSNYM